MKSKQQTWALWVNASWFLLGLWKVHFFCWAGGKGAQFLLSIHVNLRVWFQCLNYNTLTNISGGIEWKSQKQKVNPILGVAGGMPPPENVEIQMQICTIWCILEL